MLDDPDIGGTQFGYDLTIGYIVIGPEKFSPALPMLLIELIRACGEIGGPVRPGSVFYGILESLLLTKTGCIGIGKIGFITMLGRFTEEVGPTHPNIFLLEIFIRFPREITG